MLKQKKYLSLVIPLAVVLFLVVIMVLFSDLGSDKQKVVQPTPAPQSKINVSASPPKGEIKFDVKEQDRREIEFSKEQENIAQTYPWSDKLPLQTESYFVYFDVEKKAFVGLLYPIGPDQNSINSQVVDMKTKINKSLVDLGVDVAKYKFEWTIQTKNKGSN